MVTLWTSPYCLNMWSRSASLVLKDNPKTPRQLEGSGRATGPRGPPLRNREGQVGPILKKGTDEPDSPGSTTTFVPTPGRRAVSTRVPVPVFPRRRRVIPGFLLGSGIVVTPARLTDVTVTPRVAVSTTGGVSLGVPGRCVSESEDSVQEGFWKVCGGGETDTRKDRYQRQEERRRKKIRKTGRRSEVRFSGRFSLQIRRVCRESCDSP